MKEEEIFIYSFFISCISLSILTPFPEKKKVNQIYTGETMYNVYTFKLIILKMAL